MKCADACLCLQMKCSVPAKQHLNDDIKTVVSQNVGHTVTLFALYYTSGSQFFSLAYPLAAYFHKLYPLY
jgi:hypothetical protein